MHIEVRQHHVEVPKSLLNNIHRHIATDLKRFEHLIRRVCVHIADVNGPRGGEDKSCHIQVHLTHFSTVIVRDRGASLFAVVARAVARVNAAMGRAQDRIAGRRRCKARGVASQACAAW